MMLFLIFLAGIFIQQRIVNMLNNAAEHSVSRQTEDLSLLARGDHALVETTDGIEGLPAFDTNAAGNKGWHLEKATVDGVETLTFRWYLGSVFLVR